MEAVYRHRTVLLEAAVEALAVRPDGRYVDGTYGRGGHAAQLLERLGPQGRLLVLDRDPQAIAVAHRCHGDDPRVVVVQAAFSTLPAQVAQLGWSGQVDGLLLDLGVSSPQLDEAGRGFSFRHDGPLDMRMDPTTGESAAAWLARVDEGEIAQVLAEYGEERFARRIARALVAARSEAPVTRTAQLARLVASAVPTRERHKDPATRTFQALRIRVNDELGELERLLPALPELLAVDGRLVIISFHSLEDRRVKRFMRDEARGQAHPPGLPVTGWLRAPRLALCGKAVRASEAEVADNPRARSAVMRVARRVA